MGFAWWEGWSGYWEDRMVHVRGQQGQRLSMVHWRKYKESGIGGTEGKGGMLVPGSRKGNVCRADCCPLQKRLELGKGVGIEDPS